MSVRGIRAGPLHEYTVSTLLLSDRPGESVAVREGLTVFAMETKPQAMPETVGALDPRHLWCHRSSDSFAEITQFSRIEGRQVVDVGLYYPMVAARIEP